MCRFFLFLLLFLAAILDRLLALSSSDDILPNKTFKVPSPPPGCTVREEVIKRERCLRSSDPHTILSGRGGVKISYMTFLTPACLIKSFCCSELSRERNQKIKRRPCGQARTWVQLPFFFLFFLLDYALKCSRAGSSVHPLWGHEMNRW